MAVVVIAMLPAWWMTPFVPSEPIGAEPVLVEEEQPQARS